MKTNELRIGNCILIDCIMYKEERKVTEICPDGVFAKTRYTANMPEIIFIKEEDIEPIELTEEVLLKIGFEKIEFVKNEQYGYYKKICIDDYSYMLDFMVVPKDEFIRFSIRFYENEDDEVDCYLEEFRSYNIKYLHQLQNSYYCVIGEELNIEL